jgi:hypothetical protein
MSELTYKKITDAIKATEYKYFGDYELSERQRDAVETLIDAAVEFMSKGEPKSEWVSVDDFASANCYVYALCNDIVSSWVELLYMEDNKEFFFPNGTRYPAIVNSVMPIKLPTPPKD